MHIVLDKMKKITGKIKFGKKNKISKKWKNEKKVTVKERKRKYLRL